VIILAGVVLLRVGEGRGLKRNGDLSTNLH
jgi:hypothetical protein